MKKECKKYIKKIKKLSEGESIPFYDYEILCLTPKSSFMIIHDLNMDEFCFEELVDFIQNKITR